MTHADFIRTDHWFAWYPVRTEDAGWVWLVTVKRIIDDRPLVYYGMFPEYIYYLNKDG